MKLLLTVCYNGAAYAGFQYQDNAPTVQNELTVAARRVFGFDCDICGCSRTDAGVHAKGFCATLSAKNGENVIRLAPARVPDALNFYLPADISVTACREVSDDFHPRYSVTGKTYEYLIVNSKYRNPLMSGFAYQPRRVIDAEGLERMRRAASYIVGRHDFTSFMSAGSSVTDCVRTVTSLKIDENGGMLRISISADGFLYNMVRIICGTLWAVALGRIDPDAVGGIIEARDRSQAGETLPPEGLYLVSVNYPEGGKTQ